MVCLSSLYGAKILLNTVSVLSAVSATVSVARTATLMRAITEGQVEGFSPPDGVRTFYLEHYIDGSEEFTSVLRFILSDKRILATEKEVIGD